ncbi:hypothetical protein ABEG18_18060 [Alsobacter sp. KACC 23698]|uniref:Uncharacterized protein n=1 Tax=Alsobacter sp. KACC 23698 TaxID=3149229 RepID=A0AAU7JBL0_9HYPH
MPRTPRTDDPIRLPLPERRLSVSRFEARRQLRISLALLAALLAGTLAAVIGGPVRSGGTAIAAAPAKAAPVRQAAAAHVLRAGPSVFAMR